jgi:hypothetical protein
MPAPTNLEQLYSGYLRCDSRVFIAGEEAEIITAPTINKGLSSISARADIPVIEIPSTAALQRPLPDDLQGHRVPLPAIPLPPTSHDQLH